MSSNILKFPDLLRVEGVMAKGFGIICRFPMIDPDLNIAAKAIYSLICSYAGNGDTAFPSRDKIMGLLKIGKNKYYFGLNQLIDQGYITVEHRKAENGWYDSNIYTIVSNPKKFVFAKSLAGEGELTFGYSGLKSDGYGMIPKMVMFDQRLECTAKVIYAYLASYSGANKVAFPKISDILYHLGLSRNTFSRYMSSLIKLNYITRTQRRINGKLSSNNYCLNDKPDEASVQIDASPQPKNRDTVPQPKNEDTVKQDTVGPDTVKPDTIVSDPVEWDTIEPDPAEPDTINSTNIKNKSQKNSSIINSLSINCSAYWTDGMSREEIKEIIREDWELELYTPEIKQSLGITLTDNELEYFVNIAADFIYSRKPSLTVKGRVYTREEAISRILALSPDDCQFIINEIASISTPIRNQQRYILSCMVTVREDAELRAAIEVARDMKQGIV